MTPIVGLPILAMIALIILGGVVGLGVLLTNQKTAPAAWTVLVLIVPVVVIVGAIGLYLMAGLARDRTQRGATLDVATRAITEQDRAAAQTESYMPEDGSNGIPVGAPPEAPAEAATDADAEAETTDAEKPDAEATPQPEAPEAAKEKDADLPKPEAEPPSPEKTPPAEQKAPALSPPPPPWVGEEPQGTSNGYQMSIVVGPYPRRSDCDEALPAELQKATAGYIADYLDLDPKRARRVRLATSYIRDQIVQAEWEEKVENPLDAGIRALLEPEERGPMTQLHVLLEFDPKVNAHIDQEWKSAVVTERLWYTGTGVGLVLALLSVLFGCLKIDQAAGGSCRGRLGLAAVVMILGVVAMVYFVRVAAQGHPIATDIAGSNTAQIEPVGHEVSDPGNRSGPVVVLNARRAPKWLMLTTGGLLVLGGVVGLVLVLAHKKTRLAGLVVLAVVALALFLIP